MADAPLWKGPIERLGRARFSPLGGAVVIEDRSSLGKIVLHGNPRDPGFAETAAAVLGFAPPDAPNSCAGSQARRAYWTGPCEWLVICDRSAASDLGAALAGEGLACTDVSDGRAAFQLSGPRALDVLRKGTSLDLHPRRFRRGDCAQTRLAQCAVLLHRTDEKTGYGILCERSFAEYLWLWLEDAAREFVTRTRSPEEGSLWRRHPA